MFTTLDDNEWAALLSDPAARAVHGLPRLPSDEVQYSYVGKSGRRAFDEAVRSWGIFWREARKRRAFDGDSTLLDLGCGWGRFSTTALRDFAPNRITSADVQDESLDHCRAAGLPTTLLKVEPEPPMPVAPDSFDLAVAYSVFSHLREDYHWRWLHELHRVLKPGGVLAVTTRTRFTILYMRQLRESGVYHPAYLDTEDCLRRYDAGEYVFDIPHPSGALKDFYGEAAIPRAYIESEWPKVFRDVLFLPVEETGDEQSIIIATK